MPGAVAGVLLTGGESRRMGRDKALLPLGPGGVALARHIGSLLASVAEPALEVGPGLSGLEVPDGADPHEGPLVALAVAARELRLAAPGRAAIVCATDLPFLTRAVLQALGDFPAGPELSVVPVVGGRRLPLSARWSPLALEAAIDLAAAGERRLRAGIDACPLVEVGSAELGIEDLDRVLADVDDPGALERLGLELPADPGHNP